MIIRESERLHEKVEHFRGGDGVVDKISYALEKMPPHGKMFAEIRLQPGCSIGPHVHEGEYEFFFFREGEIVLNDNGTDRVMHPGDFAVCYPGEMHGIANRSDKPAAVFASIIRTED